MVGLTLHNFTSAAVGIGIAAALVRSLSRSSARTLGNFWVDLIRTTYYLLLPASLVLAVVLLSQGMIQNFDPYTKARLIEPAPGTETQLIAEGPMASLGLMTRNPAHGWSVCVAMLAGRFLMIVPVMALAGSLALKKTSPPSPGSFRVSGGTFIVLLIGTVLTTIAAFTVQADRGFVLQLALWLWFTVLFANFAEAVAEGRGKAQAESLRKARKDTFARRLRDGREERVPAPELHRGDLVVCEANDVIPAAGEVIEGIASVDEAAITGESAPVVRESGGDRSAVTGGTKVISDRIVVLSLRGTWPPELVRSVDQVSRQGGTPLVVADGPDVLGVIHLKDVVKGGIRERFPHVPRMDPHRTRRRLPILLPDPVAAEVTRRSSLFKLLSSALPSFPAPASLTHMFLRPAILAAAVALLGSLGSGCQQPVAVSNPTVSLVQPGTTPSHAHLTGIENAYQLGPRLWSGGEPHGDAAFAALAAAGIQTVVSVDGARPDVEAARRHGLQYVHIPIGYDGVPPEACAALASLSANQAGGIFIHCHHGKHRGPTAAAIVARATGAWDASTAEAWQKLAGTSPDYPGLYHSVREFQTPDSAALDSAFRALRSVVSPRGIVEAMVQIDGHAEALADMKAAGWKPIPAAPDETPVQVARLLHEQFREGIRLRLGPSDPAFADAMKASESAASALESALRNLDKPAADAAWKQVKDGCTTCHRQWRNHR